MHNWDDPEFSILKHRLARRLEFEGFTDATANDVDLVELTKVRARFLVPVSDSLSNDCAMPTMWTCWSSLKCGRGLGPVCICAGPPQ